MISRSFFAQHRAERAMDFASRFPEAAARCNTLRDYELDEPEATEPPIVERLATLRDLARFFQADGRFRYSRGRAREAAIAHLKLQGAPEPTEPAETETTEHDRAAERAAFRSMLTLLKRVGS